MKIINLGVNWSYHSVPMTIDFKAGTHEVEDRIYAAAVKDGVHQESNNGRGSTKASPKGAAD